MEQQNDEIKKMAKTTECAEKTMGENDLLLSQLEQAGKLHGHICPSLFYGVSLAMRIREWMQQAGRMQASDNHPNRATCCADSCASCGTSSTSCGESCEIILEGKSQCIRDGVRSVLGEATPFTIQSTGQCALTAACNDSQQRYRLTILPAVRSRINELNQSLPLEEFKRVGVAYLKSLPPRELFGE